MARKIYREKKGYVKKLTQQKLINNKQLYASNHIVNHINKENPANFDVRFADKQFMYDIYQHSKDHQANFKQNVLFLLRVHNYPMNRFIRGLNDNGIKITANGFRKIKDKGWYKLNYIVTFARVLNIDPGILLSADLPGIWFTAHPEQAPQWWIDRQNGDEQGHKASSGK